MHSALIMHIPMWLVLGVIMLSLGIAMIIRKSVKGFINAKEEPLDSSRKVGMAHHEHAPMQIDHTVNPYSTAEQSNEIDDSVSVYGSEIMREEREKPITINIVPYDENETMNPYGKDMMLEDEDNTVNPYDLNMKPQTGDETVNPYKCDMHLQNENDTTNPYNITGNSIVMDEEKTINPYAQDWMPKLTIGFVWEEMQKKQKKEILFTGSMWIGNSTQCELQINIPDNRRTCVELTYGGGNLYARNISRSGETVLLDDSELDDDLVPMKKGSCLKIDQIQITIAYIR